MRRFFLFFVLFLGMAGAARAEFVVDPAYEGIYNVDLVCRSKTDKRCLKFEGEFHLVVMNTIGRRGTVISFHQVPYDNRLYSFMMGKFENHGALIEGWEVLEESGRGGEFHVEIDATTKIVSGWLQDSAIDSMFEIRGEQLRSPAPFYSREVLTTTIAMDDLVGRYEGAKSARGELFLRKRRTGTGTELVAGWSNQDATVTFSFDFVEYIAERGVLNLVDYLPNGASAKWTLAVSRESGPVTLTGMLFSSNSAATRDIAFTNLGPLTP